MVKESHWIEWTLACNRTPNLLSNHQFSTSPPFVIFDITSKMFLYRVAFTGENANTREPIHLDLYVRRCADILCRFSSGDAPVSDILCRFSSGYPPVFLGTDIELGG